MGFVYSTLSHGIVSKTPSTGTEDLSLFRQAAEKFLDRKTNPVLTLGSPSVRQVDTYLFDE